MQMGFMLGRNTIDAIFKTRQMMEKYEVTGRKLYMVFVDLKKAFDHVPRELISLALRRKGVEREIKTIKKMYVNIKTPVKVKSMRSESFDLKIKVHQGLVLSPLLFAMVIDKVIKDLKGGPLADHFVLLRDSWEKVESRYF